MIFVRPVSISNWLTALELSVSKTQERFVPTVAVSLAKAYIRPNGVNYDPYAIYAEETHEMVGFYSFMYKPQDLRVVYIGGFLIDNRFQGKGYGRAAMNDFLQMIRAEYLECEGVYLTVHPENKKAEDFYSHFGFSKTGLVIDGEDAMALTLVEKA